jgi:hypothetical protein
MVEVEQNYYVTAREVFASSAGLAIGILWASFVGALASDLHLKFISGLVGIGGLIGAGVVAASIAQKQRAVVASLAFLVGSLVILLTPPGVDLFFGLGIAYAAVCYALAHLDEPERFKKAFVVALSFPLGIVTLSQIIAINLTEEFESIVSRATESNETLEGGYDTADDDVRTQTAVPLSPDDTIETMQAVPQYAGRWYYRIAPMGDDCNNWQIDERDGELHVESNSSGLVLHFDGREWQMTAESESRSTLRTVGTFDGEWSLRGYGEGTSRPRELEYMMTYVISRGSAVCRMRFQVFAARERALLPRVQRSAPILKDSLPQEDANIQQIQGRLEPGDIEMDDGSWYDEYSVEWLAGERYTVTMRSRSFDTYLVVQSPIDQYLGNDNSGGGTDARLVIQVAQTGIWRLRASARDRGKGGPYMLQIRRETE